MRSHIRNLGAMLGAKFGCAAVIFAAAGSASAQCQWNVTSAGFNGTVHALTSWDPDGGGPAQPLLIAGGEFSTVGSVSAGRIAAWNGTTWSALGSGVGVNFDTVNTLGIFNGELIAAGQFATAGSTTVNNIARWNGSQWRALGTGTDSTVNALTVFNGQLIAGGFFSNAGGTAVNAIARWNGSAWSALGSGIGGDVYGLTVFGSDLVVGGQFSTAGGMAAKNAAKWSGSAWTALGTANGRDQIIALAVYNNQLYAAGFPGAGNDSGVVRWNGSAWVTMGPGGVTNSGLALAVYNGELYASGRFETAGGVNVNNIAKWNGSAWSAVGAGITAPSQPNPWALMVHGGALVVAGDFTGVNSQTAGRWARWSCGCPSDFNGDGFVSGDDFDQYVAAFESGNIAADFNDDGFVTGDDFDAFVAAFSAGC